MLTAALVLLFILVIVYLSGVVLWGYLLRGFGISLWSRLWFALRWPKAAYNGQAFMYEMMRSSGGAGISLDEEEEEIPPTVPNSPPYKDLN